MTKKRRDLGNQTYFTVFNSDMKLIKDPVKKILFSKIKNWIYRNEDKESDLYFKAGYWWTFAPYEYWAEECGLETKTVGKHLRGLVSSGILKTGNYNKKGYDKTIWYRLATADELKKVNFQVLLYGKSNEKDITNHSNETILQMYQNGMIDVTKRDVLNDHLGVPILEDNLEHISDYILENSLESSLQNSLDNILKDNQTTTEEHSSLNEINENSEVSSLILYNNRILENNEYNNIEYLDTEKDINSEIIIDNNTSSTNFKLDKMYCFNELNLLYPNGWYEYLLKNGVNETFTNYFDFVDHYNDEELGKIALYIERLLE
jgi:hypothetical protein